MTRGVRMAIRVARNFAPIALVAMLCCAAHGVATNRVLTVDQDGNVSSTKGLATQADLAAIAMSNELARAEQAAAKDGYETATNLLSAAAQSVLTTPVIYMGVEMTGFEAAVAFDENSKVLITGIRPKVREVAVDGTACWETEIDFAFQEALQDVQPLVEWTQALAKGHPRSGWDILQGAYVTAPVLQEGSYTDRVGTVYANVYTMSARIPKEYSGEQSFLAISVPNDAALADGTAYDMPGVKGGYSGTVEWGENVLVFRGGYLVEVAK